MHSPQEIWTQSSDADLQARWDAGWRYWGVWQGIFYDCCGRVQTEPGNYSNSVRPRHKRPTYASIRHLTQCEPNGVGLSPIEVSSSLGNLALRFLPTLHGLHLRSIGLLK